MEGEGIGEEEEDKVGEEEEDKVEVEVRCKGEEPGMVESGGDVRRVERRGDPRLPGVEEIKEHELRIYRTGTGVPIV